MSQDEKMLFLDAMEDVKPLKTCRGGTQWNKAKTLRPRQHTDTLQLDNFLTTGYLDIVPPGEPLAFKREGVQTGVLDKLRQGKYPRQATLNLLRQPVEQCRQMLYAFIIQAKREGLRNLLIIHGRGSAAQSHANIVRSYVARWLTEFNEVQAYCSAQLHHGGSGACYVALRKSAQAKLDNRERHAARRAR
ncbi:DNA endonuclease SmrA [Enterobacteriaceae bacterium YMB-R22]|jgi:DNA-nicking Smr family endonuclease|uniref:DNA endonuclease SmrA n=1 Tax=Tenebrionicola larvae TaxID=2815733 RepID=UPI002011F5D5|nr:DNA endonuclease SmrA [Tenebrionicola larvae]MBV4413492.1 DNA endonuclease SmrA [Tenebrionicola larvae]